MSFDEAMGVTMRRRTIAAGAVAAAVLAGLTAGLLPARAQNATTATDGPDIYTQSGCVGCHGPNGEGGVGPALAANPDLANSALVVNQILFGGEIMPPFAAVLTDEQVVTLSNYIRSSWGNTNTTPTEIGEVTQTRTEGAPAAGG
ncbi:MAG: c-type cytochrome [Bauldia sp.]|jgi:mono/diheme cytochrome c family protein